MIRSTQNKVYLTNIKDEQLSITRNDSVQQNRFFSALLEEREGAFVHSPSDI